MINIKDMKLEIKHITPYLPYELKMCNLINVNEFGLTKNTIEEFFGINKFGLVFTDVDDLLGQGV